MNVQLTKHHEQQREYYNRGTNVPVPIRKGDKVKIQPVQLEKKWIMGTVTEQAGILYTRCYKVIAGGEPYI